MRRYFYLIVLMFFAFCPNIFAAVCSDNEKVNYQNLAKNITSSYSYVEENNSFNITFTNVPNNFYIKNIENETIYSYQNSEMILTGFTPGKSYKFGIYTTDFYCRNENLFNIYITLPYYNSFYKDALCEGIENYKYCMKFISNPISYEQFTVNVNNYKESLKDNSEEIIEDNTFDKYFSYLLEFYLDYYYIILPVIIVISFIIIWKHNRKDDLF